MIAAKSICSSQSSTRVAQLVEARDGTARGVLSISIIVPVLDEAELITPFLLHLRERAPGAELIVVDGGSTDATRQAAEKLCDQLVVSEPGRARQLNAGAMAARGEVFWFLHVDSEVPAGCLGNIRRALAAREVAGGYFRIRLPKKHAIYGSLITSHTTPESRCGFAAGITGYFAGGVSSSKAVVFPTCR
ncbi:MAG: glycosyltransferase [Chthoniobacterales bacterium]|nr:glycosyltransferase [Chthoniobacterales bacterium]